MRLDSISNSVIKGVTYLSGQTIFIKILFLLRTVILARLLSPIDFRIISLSIVLLQGLGSITAVGTDKLLIQREKLDKNIIGNAFSLNISRGIILTALTILLCPFYTTLIKQPVK